jgi:hypothetical protein
MDTSDGAFNWSGIPFTRQSQQRAVGDQESGALRISGVRFELGGFPSLYAMMFSGYIADVLLRVAVDTTLATMAYSLTCVLQRKTMRSIKCIKA